MEDVGDRWSGRRMECKRACLEREDVGNVGYERRSVWDGACPRSYMCMVSFCLDVFLMH